MRLSSTPKKAVRSNVQIAELCRQLDFNSSFAKVVCRTEIPPSVVSFAHTHVGSLVLWDI